MPGITGRELLAGVDKATRAALGDLPARQVLITSPCRSVVDISGGLGTS